MKSRKNFKLSVQEQSDIDAYERTHAALNKRSAFYKKHPDSPLHILIDGFLEKRGIEIEHGPFNVPVSIGDERDGRGQFITRWDDTVLGAWPSEVDGFTSDQLRAKPN